MICIIILRDWVLRNSSLAVFWGPLFDRGERAPYQTDCRLSVRPLSYRLPYHTACLVMQSADRIVIQNGALSYRMQGQYRVDTAIQTAEVWLLVFWVYRSGVVISWCWCEKLVCWNRKESSVFLYSRFLLVCSVEVKGVLLCTNGILGWVCWNRGNARAGVLVFWSVGLEFLCWRVYWLR